jgi:hypothetical protein
MGEKWHHDCLCCVRCKTPMAHSFSVFGRDPYCEKHANCARCLNPFPGGVCFKYKDERYCELCARLMRRAGS